MKAWQRITWPCDRLDFLAWRETEDGTGMIEVLVYNNCYGDVPHSMYVERAPSLCAIGFREEV